jgi:hypothetical protein
MQFAMTYMGCAMLGLFLALHPTWVQVVLAQDFSGLPPCAVISLGLRKPIETDDEAIGNRCSARATVEWMSAFQHHLHLPEYAMDQLSRTCVCGSLPSTSCH